MTDITEQKLAEALVADKDAQLQVALENMPGALAYTDRNLNIVFCNARFREMYIVPPELLQPGRAYTDLLRYLAENGYYGEGDVDARSLVVGAPVERPEGSAPELVSTVFITYPRQDNFEAWRAAVAELRADLPEALMVTVLLPYDEQLPKRALVEAYVDMILRSFEEGLAFVAPDRSAPARAQGVAELVR